MLKPSDKTIAEARRRVIGLAVQYMSSAAAVEHPLATDEVMRRFGVIEADLRRAARDLVRVDDEAARSAANWLADGKKKHV